MYRYLRQTPTQSTVKDNFVLPGARLDDDAPTFPG